MTETPLTECPVCGYRVRRVVNSVGVLFKGSGFYVTDSRNGHTNGKAASNTPGSASASEGKEDHKPATDGEKAPAKEPAATPAAAPAADSAT